MKRIRYAKITVIILISLNLILFQNCKSVNDDVQSTSATAPTQTTEADPIEDPDPGSEEPKDPGTNTPEPVCHDVEILSVKSDFRSSNSNRSFFILTNENKVYSLISNNWTLIADGPIDAKLRKIDFNLDAATSEAFLFGIDNDNNIWKRSLDNLEPVAWTNLNLPIFQPATDFVALNNPNLAHNFLLYTPASTAQRIVNDQLYEYSTSVNRSLLFVGKNSKSENYFNGLSYDGKSIYVVKATFNNTSQKFGNISSSLRLSLKTAHAFQDFDSISEDYFYALKEDKIYWAQCFWTCQTLNGVQYCNCTNSDWNILKTLITPNATFCED